MNTDATEKRAMGGAILPLCDRTVCGDVSCDISVPDHLPEVRKLLCVTEKLYSPAKYIGANNVECSGGIEYRVIYLGADGELYMVSADGEYELSTPKDAPAYGELGTPSAIIYASCDGTTARVVSPRKISAKSRIHAAVFVFAPLAEAEDMPESIERLCRTAECCKAVFFAGEPIELEDRISGLGDDARIISVDTSVLVSEVRCVGNEIAVSGDVSLRLLLGRESGQVQTVERRIPFKANTELPDGMSECPTAVVGNVTDIEVSAAEGDIEIDISMVLEATLAENREWGYTADAYSTERECTCTCGELRLPISALCSAGSFSQNERLSQEEQAFPEGGEVVGTWCSVVFDGCESEGDRYIFSGSAKYTLICKKDGEYSSFDVERPVRYSATGREVEPFRFGITATPLSCRGRIDGGTLCIDSEISVNAFVFGVNTVFPARDISVGDLLKKRPCELLVYYPTPTETPWDVAKKYHVRADSLSAEKNYYLF